MKKKLLLSAISMALSGQVMAAAYKIPEQSLNSTALSGAYVANAHGADASYNNPAAMAFNEDGSSVEVDLTFISLSGIKVDNDTFAPLDANFGTDYYRDETKAELFILPAFHYVGEPVGDFRYGFSLIFPAGLTKRWKGVNKAFAEEFTLQTIEVNPTLAYKVTDRFSVGGGLRAMHSKGIVRSADDAFLPIPGVTNGMPFGRLMKGNSWDFGYNLAMHFKATDSLDLAVTYRSEINLTEKGDARLTFLPLTDPVYEDSAKVEVPVPATLTLAGAYTFDRTTVELLYERNYWSAYEYLDFEYAYPLDMIPGIGEPLYQAFDRPLPKHWKDSNTFRIGLTHKWDDRLTLMAGYAYDETPVPEEYVGFELPDSDANIFSAGFRYRLSDRLEIGAALLYDRKDKLVLSPGENLEAGGALAGGATFKDASAYLLTLGMDYAF